MTEFIDVDLFAGGGGVSEGLRLATGRGPDIAVNHSPDAIACHQVNHPDTEHYISDVFAVDPVTAARGRRVRALWLSPDCKHHSKAKGGKPLDRNIRDLAWIAFKWIEGLPEWQRPIVVGLENVAEFADWGPLDAADRPIKERKGETFRAFCARFRANGYEVAHKVMCCADYGAPTIRKRLVLQARRDGRPIVWPRATHAKRPMFGEAPWRAAAECIDWDIPCPSIFLTREDGRRIGVKRPLAPNTLARIAKGVQRYVINTPTPFIAPITHHGDHRTHAINEPVRTITAAARGELALITPFIAGCGGRMGQSPPKSAAEPLNTMTAKADQILVTPFIAPRYGERPSQEPRTQDVETPLPTVTPDANAGMLVAPHLMMMRNAAKPFNGADEPAHTITAGGAHLNLVAAFLAQHNDGPRYSAGGHAGKAMADPVSTVTTSGAQQGVVAAHLLNLKGAARRDSDVRAPSPAICAQGNHVAEVRAFLVKYFSTAIGAGLDEPAHTVTAKPRFGLVMVHGEPYQIVDIGMRMLSPRELFRAQSFPDSYVIDRRPDGSPLSKTTQIAHAGNAVPPQFSAAVWRAMLGDDACLPLSAPEALAA